MNFFLHRKIEFSVQQNISWRFISLSWVCGKILAKKILVEYFAINADMKRMILVKRREKWIEWALFEYTFVIVIVYFWFNHGTEWLQLEFSLFSWYKYVVLILNSTKSTRNIIAQRSPFAIKASSQQINNWSIDTGLLASQLEAVSLAYSILLESLIKNETTNFVRARVLQWKWIVFNCWNWKLWN